MHNRISSFLERLEIPYDFQFGFRANHSITLSLIHLINKIASAIDREQISGWYFLDLSKAFNALDHGISFSKLEHYGICGLALKWIRT